MNDQKIDKMIQENHWNKLALRLSNMLDESIFEMVKSGELLIFHKVKDFNGDYKDNKDCYVEITFED
jgi:hypothetical protein